MKSFEIENFRTFKNKGYLKLNGVSILTGTNSSGKSSVIKLFKVLHNNISKKDNVDFFTRISELDYSLSSNFDYTPHFLGAMNNVISTNSKNPNSFNFNFNFFHEIFENLSFKMEYSKDNKSKLNNGILQSFSIYDSNCSSKELLLQVRINENFKNKTQDEIIQFLLNNNSKIILKGDINDSDIFHGQIKTEPYFEIKINTNNVYKLIDKVYSYAQDQHWAYEISRKLVFKEVLTKKEKSIRKKLADERGWSFDENFEGHDYITSPLDDYLKYWKVIDREGKTLKFSSEKNKFIDSYLDDKTGEEIFTKNLKISFNHKYRPFKKYSPLFTAFKYKIIPYVLIDEFTNEQNEFILDKNERIDFANSKHSTFFKKEEIYRFEDALEKYNNVYSLLFDLQNIEKEIIEKNININIDFQENQITSQKAFNKLYPYGLHDDIDEVKFLKDLLKEDKNFIKVPKYQEIYDTLINKKFEGIDDLDLIFKYNISHERLMSYIISEINGEINNKNDNHPFTKLFDVLLSSNNNFISTVSNFKFIDIIRGNIDRFYNDSSSQNNSFTKLLIEFSKAKNISDSDYNFINIWLQEFEIADELVINRDSNNSGTEIYLLKDKQKRILADLGYGISQFIPILLHIILNKEKVICIEEPEANLHPKLQSLLADLFVDAMKDYNIKFIIETHSEYLIRRLQYLVLKKDVDPQNISLNYFNANSKDSIYEINILEDGSLDKEFGEGFLDENKALVLSLFTGNYRNKN
ncbi:hypothetical protein EI427_01195 [Flammeovirga pectinis]|uniref:ATPase AAA-type core domain-containing protein n=1 Tax=Flammeovirga pectinis TaxID=2494373 RepID=A0A3Q9FIE9_9BACT|nr:AAA family ATPase [Flammeovirga pectinis]AZQ60874.1 hypothetical protein EI427_01195 [Flammeovirga pectinis]